MMNNPQNFPLSALPGNLQELTWQLHRESGAPIPSIASALLAVMSLVCQGKVKIRKRSGLVSPVSLWFVVVLGSGERKSAVMKTLFRGVDEFMAEHLRKHREQLEDYEQKLNAWKAEGQGVLDSIRKKSSKNEDAGDDYMRLEEHNARKPLKPKKFKLIHEKFTPVAMIRNLAECYPTTGLISDEAACVFDGRGISDMGLLNKGWDGATLSNETITKGSVEVLDPALTMALYVQREVIEAFLQGKGALAKAVGFLSRCYYVAPHDTAGSRFLANSLTASAVVTETFYSRCKQILQSHVTECGHLAAEKVELHFSRDAQIRWEQEHDHIESLMNPGGYFYDHRDFASKHGDKIARLAALLHYFDEIEGPISLETLERSIVISGWYAEEHVRNFTMPHELPQEQRDAQLLLAWLANYVRVSNGALILKKNHLRQNVANALRNKTRLNAALFVLWQQGILSEGKNAEDKTTYIMLNTNYFTPSQVYFLCSPTTPIGG